MNLAFNNFISLVLKGFRGDYLGPKVMRFGCGEGFIVKYFFVYRLLNVGRIFNPKMFGLAGPVARMRECGNASIKEASRKA